MKKSSKRDNINLFFSSFLIVAFLVCVYFFLEFSKTLSGTIGTTITVALSAVFGLLLFYATRVGEGKAIKRFSPFTFILLVIPSFYILLATVFANFPLHQFFITESGDPSALALLSGVVFGYGVLYSFLSGFELDYDEDALALYSGEETDGEEISSEETDSEKADSEENGDTVDSQEADDVQSVDTEKSNEEAVEETAE